MALSFYHLSVLYNICLQMSIRKIIGMENGIEDFRLQIAPRSITIPKNSKGLRLYLQKGMQIIGKFENDPNITLKESFYRFRSVRPVQFRMTNLNHSNYSWTLYLVNPETQQESFVDSALFNVERTIKLYQMELLDKEREIQTSFREKTITKALVLQLWNKVKKEMKTYKSTLKCVFSNQDCQIQFQVEIKNSLDYEAQKLMIEKQSRPLKRQKSDDFSSSNGSDLKGKREGNSQLKEKYSQKTNFIQIQFSPYKSSKLKGDEMNTKQTIQLEPDTYSTHDHNTNYQQSGDKQKTPFEFENFNGIVKVVDPTGEQIDVKKQEQNQNSRKGSYSDSSSGSNRQFPMKKFSLLSDIIEMTYEESSSYGHPDQSSSNGFNQGAFRKDRTLDFAIQHQMPNQAHGLNKFKTLQYQSQHRHRLQVTDEFRRAQTTEKNQNDFQTSSQLQEQSYISVNEDKRSILKQVPKPSSGDPYGKWIILTAIIIIIGIVAGTFIGQDNGGNTLKKKSKKRRQVN